MFRWPKIPLGLRFFFLYFVIIIITAYMVSRTVVHELKPAVRQTTEEALVDMANLLAVVVESDVNKSHINKSDLNNSKLSAINFSQLLETYQQRDPQAQIWEIGKKTINTRIYITDQNGIVIADSWQKDVGKDFSQWNDVYLTLRGQYGARSTAENPDDPSSSVMHVAAPIYHQGKIIGSVTVAKSNRSVQPFIDLSTRNVLIWLIWMGALVLIVGGLFAWRINSALHKLETYATKMGNGEKVTKPTFRIFYEYGHLSNALEKMRQQLDGKEYVEQYVQTLTHELKSPLSAIKGASEILQMPALPEDKVARFAGNIERESDRMQSLIDKLLHLARLEKQPELEDLSTIYLAELVEEIIQSSDARLTAKSVTCSSIIPQDITLLGEPFLLKQTLFNLMDNALDFVSQDGEIKWRAHVMYQKITISIFNTGNPIPDYALPRLTERFYSLARNNGNKSTGLGLNFVEQVMKLHQGLLQIENVEQGVKVTLTLPSGMKKPNA
ncbi:MAG: two-component system sensor histidine kinase CreC [Vibrio sp.]